MNTAEQFTAFYEKELARAASLPERIAARYRADACLVCSQRKEVYLLTSPDTGEQAVLRRLPPGLGETNRMEFDLLGALSHPRIPKAIELFEENGASYLLRSYIPGVSLSQWIASRGTASEREAVRILIQLCDLLTYLHTRRPPVIHRDIKPQNVILSPDGSVSLIDFDIARRFDPKAASDTAYMGTAATAPPEQYGYGQTNARSDVYALGVLLVYLMTARYERAALPELPPRLRRIAKRCMEFAPKDRYASTAQLRRALPASIWAPLPRLVAMLAAVAALAGAFLLGRWSAQGADMPLLSSLFRGERLPSVAKDGTVTFADAGIEELVRLKLDKPQGEPVTISELASITDLSVVGVSSENRSLPIDFYQDQAYQNGEAIARGEIKTLSDLSLMKSLESVVLAYQRIEDISPLEDLHLKALVLVGNYISDLTPLSDMTTLRELNLNNNSVEDLSPLQSLDRLEKLFVQCCNITDITPLIKIAALTTVDIADNPCDDFSTLAALEAITHIDISDNGVEAAIAASANPAVRELYANGCGISSLEGFGDLPNLNTLELCGNGMLDISGIERYADLIYLALRNESIPDLTPLTGLPNLRELDLREADADLSPLLECASLQKVICSPDMQSRVDAIKDEAQFVIEIKALP